MTGERAVTPYYDEDGITIYHGDAREVLPTLERNSVDLLVTDPPWVRLLAILAALDQEVVHAQA